MKRLATLCFLFAFGALNAQAAASGWLSTVAEAKKQAKQKNQLILVDMFADWCGWCHRMEKEVFPSEKFRTAAKNLVLLRLDTEDGGEGQQVSRDFAVQNLPTFLLLTPDMMVAGIIRGYSPPNEFVKRVGEAEKAYVEFQKRAAAKTANDQQSLTIAKEFLERRGLAEAETRLTKLTMSKTLTPAMTEEVYFILAVAQGQQKKYDKSIKSLQTLQKKSKQGPFLEKSRLMEAQIYLEQGKLKDALAAYKRFQAAYPASPQIQNVNYMIPQIEKEIARPATAQ